MVIVSHDREFLDQLCTKVVETERGVATTYKGEAARPGCVPACVPSQRSGAEPAGNRLLRTARAAGAGLCWLCPGNSCAW